MLSEVQKYCPKPIHGPEFQQFFATLPLTVSVYSTHISTEKKDPVPRFSVPEPSGFQKKKKKNDVDTLQTQ